MVKVIMHGCNGHMGQVITQLVEKDPEIEIVAGIDLNDCRDNGYPVFTDIWTCDVQAERPTHCWNTVKKDRSRLYYVLRV